MASGGVRGAEILLELRGNGSKLDGDLRKNADHVKMLTSKLEAATKQLRIQEETIRNTKAQLKAMSAGMERQNALTKERAKVEAQLATATRKMEAQGKAVERLANALEVAQQKATRLSAADYSKGQQAIASLEKQVNAAGNEFDKLSKTVELLQDELGEIEIPDDVFKAEFDSLTEGLAETTAAMSETAEEAKILMRELDKLDTAGGFERASKSANNFLVILGNIGKVGGGVFGGIKRAAGMLYSIFRRLVGAAVAVSRAMVGALGSILRLSIVAYRGFGRIFALFNRLVPQLNLFNRGLGRANNNMRRFAQRFWRLTAGWAFFILIRRAVQQTIEDIRTLTQHSESLNRSMNEIRVHGWIAMGAVWTSLLPILERLAVVIATATRALALFVVLLTGNSWAAAVEMGEALYNQARGYDDVASSARAARKQLMGFDELNRLTADTGDEVSGLDFGAIEMPDEALIDWVQRLVDMLNELWDNILKFGTPDFDPEYWFNLGHRMAQRLADGLAMIPWERINAIITDGLHALAEFINGIFANDDLWYQIERAIRVGLGGLLDAFTNFLNVLDGLTIGRRIAGIFDALVDIIPNAARTIHAGLHLLFDVFDGFFDEAFFRNTFWKLGENLGYAITLISDIIPRLGKTASDAVNAFFQIIGGLAYGAQWVEIGLNISQGMTNLITGIDWDENARHLYNLVNGLITTIYVALSSADWRSFGSRMTSGLMVLIEGVSWGKLGVTLSALFNSLFDYLRGAIDEFDPSTVATAISDFINNAVRTINLAEAGSVVSDIALALLNTILLAVRQTDWEAIGAEIRDFFVNIEWREIISTAWEIIREAFSGIHDFLAGLFDSDEMASTIMKVAGAFLALKAAFALLKPLVAPLASAFLSLVGTFIGAGGSTAGLAGATNKVKGALSGLGKALGAKAGPIGLAVVAVGYLVSAMARLWQNSEEVRDRMSAAFSRLGDSLGNVFSAIMPLFESAGGLLSRLFDLLAPYAMNMIINAVNLLAGAFEILAGVLDILVGAITFVIELITGLFDLITGRGTVEDWGDRLIEPFLQIGRGFEGLIRGIVETLFTIFETVVDTLIGLPASIIAGFLEGLLGFNFYETAKTWAENIRQNIRHWFQDLPVIGGLFGQETGEEYAEGIYDGIRYASDLVYDAGYALVYGLAQGMSDADVRIAAAHEAHKAHLRKLGEAYEEVRRKGSDAFNRLSMDVSASLEEMRDNLLWNAKATAEWGENIAEIMQEATRRGVEDGVLTQLLEMANRGPGYAQMFVDDFDFVFGELVPAMGEVSNAAISSVAAQFSEDKSVVRDGVDLVSRAGSEMYDTATTEGHNAGGAFTQGITRGIDAATRAARQAAIDLANETNGGLRDAWEMRSPSRVATGYGENYGNSLADGISSTANDIRSALATALSSTLEQTLDSLNTFNLRGVELGTQLLDGFKEIKPRIKEAVNRLMRNMEQAVTSGSPLAITALKNMYNQMLNHTQTFANHFTSAIHSMVSQIVELFNQIPEGTHFRMPSPPRTHNIPRLAQGAVLPGGNPFLAVVNDQPRGQMNVETPLSVIEQAVSRQIAPLMASPLSASVTAALAAQGARMGGGSGGTGYGGEVTLSRESVIAIAESLYAKFHPDNSDSLSMLGDIRHELKAGNTLKSGSNFGRAIVRAMEGHGKQVGLDMAF